MSHPHPAINAHLASIACAQNGQKEQWLSLFADDAVVHDPVGPSPHDPTGEGFTGKERLKEFWDLMIGPSTMSSHHTNRLLRVPPIAPVLRQRPTIWAKT